MTKLRATLKASAAESYGTLSQLVANKTTHVPVNIHAGLGNPGTVKCVLRRERARHMPKNPASLSDLTLDAEWTTTIDGEQFLLYDIGVYLDSRMLVFGTEEGLQRLASSDSWFMDGTFDVAPLLFTQLYIIRVPLGDSAVTCAYAFLHNKKQATYEELFTTIQDKCHSLGFNVDPVTVTVDFEQSVINALTLTFGAHLSIHGCFYHLTQSTLRKIESLGLVHRYPQEEDVKLFCGMLDGLAFQKTKLQRVWASFVRISQMDWSLS